MLARLSLPLRKFPFVDNASKSVALSALLTAPLIPHTWHDVGETPGRMLVVAQPAGHMEAFVKDLETMTPAEMLVPGAEKALMERHNMGSR